MCIYSIYIYTYNYIYICMLQRIYHIFCFTPCFPFKNPWRNFPGFSGPLNRCGPAMCWGSPKLCFIGKIGRAGYCFKFAFIGIPKVLVAVGFGTDPIWTRPKRVIVFEFWASSPKRCFIFQPHPDSHGVNSSPQHVAVRSIWQLLLF